MFVSGQLLHCSTQDVQQWVLVFISDMTSACKMGAICWCGQEPTWLLGISVQNIQTPPRMLCCGISLLVARPTCFGTKLLRGAAQLWLVSLQEGGQDPPLGVFGHWSPLWRTSGLPDHSISRKKGCPLQLGHPSSGMFLLGGRSEARSLREEGNNQTLGSQGLGHWPKGSMILSFSSSNTPTEASQQLHLNWLRMSQRAFFSHLVLPDIMKNSFLHVEFASKSKDSWARQNTAFWQSSFLN